LIASTGMSELDPETTRKLASKAFPVTQFVYPKGPREAAWARKCQNVDDAFVAFWTVANRVMSRMCSKELFDLGKAVDALFIGPRTNWASLSVFRPCTWRGALTDTV
jgi:hypothetical protein